MSKLDRLIGKLFPCDRELKKIMRENTQTQEEVLQLMRNNVEVVVTALKKSVTEANQK